MSQNGELGKLAQYALVNTSTNTVYFVNNTSSVSVGNTSITTAPNMTVANASSNLVITSSSISIGGVVVVNSLSVPSPGVNVAAQYTWTNTHTFQNTITFSSVWTVGANVSANVTALFIGNSSVNAYYNQTGFVVANGTITTNVGTLGVYVGSNSYINSSAYVAGTSTVNAYITSAGLVISNSTTTAVANTTGHYTGTIGASSNGSSLTNNQLLIGNTSIQSNIQPGAITVGSVSGAYFYANSTNIGSPYFNSNNQYAIYSGGTNMYVGGTISGGFITAISMFTVGQSKRISGSLSLTSTSPANTDIELNSYTSAGTTSYNFLRVAVFGQYIANTAASQNTSGASTLNQSHLWKTWDQGAWANVGSTYVLEGGTVTSSYNGDATNFPAGAINAAKALLVAGAAGSGSLVLRLIQRTTPATGSATYFAYTIDITTY
jgi:hypothetical protein